MHRKYKMKILIFIIQVKLQIQSILMIPKLYKYIKVLSEQVKEHINQNVINFNCIQSQATSLVEENPYLRKMQILIRNKKYRRYKIQSFIDVEDCLSEILILKGPSKVTQRYLPQDYRITK